MFDPGVACCFYAALALWVLGYPEQAIKRIRESLSLADKLSHPSSSVFALSGAAWAHRLLRDEQAVQRYSEMALALSAEYGLRNWVGMATINQGWVLAEQGQKMEGIAQIQEGVDNWRATGAENSLPYDLAILAEAYGKAGKPEEGLAVLAEALEITKKNGERWYEAETYRLKGELILQQFQVSGSKLQVTKSPESGVRGPESEAEECFLKAI